MPEPTIHFRNAPGTKLEWHDADKKRGFSNFSFVDENFSSSPTLRRIFSLARKTGYQSLAIEEIDEADCALLQSENEALALRTSRFTGSRVRRLLFLSGTSKDDPGKLLGYAVFKTDELDGPSDGLEFKGGSNSYVYESVLLPHRSAEQNNFLHSCREYTVETPFGSLVTRGSLFAQQNGLTNACAHVSLRTMISSVLDDGALHYLRFNEIANIDLRKHPKDESLGLEPLQMEAILSALGLPFSKVIHAPKKKTKCASCGKKSSIATEIKVEEKPDYSLAGEFQRDLYGLIESGLPALVGFQIDGCPNKHIIPVIGHTFNEDTWVPQSARIYFADGTGYFPSEKWLSSYVAHDDNFGPYYCIPRHYLRKKNFRIILGLKPRKTANEAPEIEALGLNYIGVLAGLIGESGTNWQRRFALFARNGILVLRTLLIDKATYLHHLANDHSWIGESIASGLLDRLHAILPDYFWSVEFSAPELFPATRHKFGEVLLRSDKPIPEQSEGSMHPADNGLILAARVPGLMFLSENDIMSVSSSGILSHVPLLRLPSVYQKSLG